MTMAMKMAMMIMKMKIMKVMFRMMKMITLMRMKAKPQLINQEEIRQTKRIDNLKKQIMLCSSTILSKIKIIPCFKRIHFLALLRIYFVTDVPGAVPRPAFWLLTTPIFLFSNFIS